MRVSLATLAFLLTIAALHSEASPEPADNPTTCCLSYISRKIPLSFVKDYERTSDLCSQPGVIFLTKKMRQICADPKEAWVEKYIRYLDSQK
ncbi:C-C motif chemokine 3 [Camelus dromedarius]|uniref:C-C motif chemokine n=2 Tax=Camelus TaxID=9836 RepID=A0A5N4D4N0_CAMDR|nr:regakine-1-like [Camelus bactrianus]XP_010988803.1 regakine-1 [Camelus dromedarius]EPY88428.1 regakine-1-like protein [Camelus ferus]KAB1266030.1 C-C motif chemokine 3 [Camelus dromedarius]